MNGYFIPIVGGIVLFAFNRGWKRVSTWQEGKRDMNQADHKLLHTLADALMDKKDLNGNVIPGTISKVDSIESNVSAILERLPK